MKPTNADQATGLWRVFTVVFASIISLAIAWPTHAAEPQRKQYTRDGLGLFTVLLDKNAVDRVDARDEPPARPTRNPMSQDDIYGWHAPKVRSLVKQLESEFKVKAVAMTSHTLPTFSAYMSVATVERMREDRRVRKVAPDLDGGSQFSAWSDSASGSEWVPWGIQAVGAVDETLPDTGYQQRSIYMIDGPAIITSNPVTLHNDVYLQIGGNNGITSTYAADHANHVAGILGGYKNNTGTRGVAPGIKVINVVTDNSPLQNRNALDWVYAETIRLGIYAVVNISSSGSDWRAVDPTNAGFNLHAT